MSRASVKARYVVIVKTAGFPDTAYGPSSADVANKLAERIIRDLGEHRVDLAELESSAAYTRATYLGPRK